jgi:AcrR family transcriptional regulator
MRFATAKDQRSRLLRAIVCVVSKCGYANAKIGEISSQAGVSRATFYEHFQDKEACFTEAHRGLARKVSQELEAAIGRAEHAYSAHTAIAMLVLLAQRRPRELAFLTHHALLAGPRARDSHDRLMGTLQRAIEGAWERSLPQDAAPDVPARLLLGGSARLCCMRLRRGEGAAPDLLPTLLRWVESYRTDDRPGERRERLRVAEASFSPGVGWASRGTSPRTLPRGRHRLPRDVVDAIQRERIAYATAAVIEAHGGTGVAVSDIVAAAGVSREVFYAYFSDKEQAFLATHQLIFEQLMAASSSAFFVPDASWPERVWQGACAFAGLLAANPSFAHFAFVAALGMDETGVRRMDESSLAFGVFLEEGYRARPQATDLPHLTSDAIALGVMELAAVYVRQGRTSELPHLVPTIAYSALAPFIGPRAAGEFLAHKLAPTRTAGARGT